MRISSVKFRGDKVDVEWKVVEDDPSTNAFEIEWDFVEQPNPPATVTESDDIICQLAVSDRNFDDDFDDDVI